MASGIILKSNKELDKLYLADKLGLFVVYDIFTQSLHIF